MSSASLLPFYGQYPAGYAPPTGAGTSASTSSGSTSSAASANPNNPVDIVDIRSTLSAGGFTAAAGDLFALRDLYKGTAPAGGGIAGYKVAVRSDQASPNDGRLLLGNVDVTDRTDFTADEFSQLHFVAGPSGSRQDLVVVARTGTRGADGTLSGITDSPAVQITASVTGTRSINATGALLTPIGATDSDANFLKVAQEASVFTGSGVRPSLSTVGNPYNSQADLDLLIGLLGAFQSSAPAPTSGFDIPSQYADGTGGSQTLGLTDPQQANGQAVVPWALGETELAGFQTAGSNLALQSFAVAAYQVN